MAKYASFGKRENEKKKQARRVEKQNRKEERKFEKTDRMKIIRKIYPGVRKRYEKKASNACTGRKLRLSLHRV